MSTKNLMLSGMALMTLLVLIGMVFKGL